jgi:hypothetical protein
MLISSLHLRLRFLYCFSTLCLFTPSLVSCSVYCILRVSFFLWLGRHPVFRAVRSSINSYISHQQTEEVHPLTINSQANLRQIIDVVIIFLLSWHSRFTTGWGSWTIDVMCSDPALTCTIIVHMLLLLTQISWCSKQLFALALPCMRKKGEAVLRYET